MAEAGAMSATLGKGEARGNRRQRDQLARLPFDPRCYSPRQVVTFHAATTLRKACKAKVNPKEKE